MASFVKYFIALLLLYVTSTVSKKSSRTTVVLVPKKLSSCKNVVNNGLDVKTFNVQIYGRRSYAFNTNITFTRGFKTLSRLVADITKCSDDVETGNTCEHFQRWSWSDKEACNTLDNRNAFYFDLIRNVEPAPIACPLKPDTYKYTNCTLDVNILQVMPFPLEGNLWLVDINMIDSEGRPNCFHMGFDFHRVRA